MEIIVAVTGAFLAFMSSLILWRIQKHEKERQKREAEKAAVERKRNLLLFKYTAMTGDLAYAVGRSYQEGRCNGELKAAIKQYEETNKERNEFMIELAAEL